MEVERVMCLLMVQEEVEVLVLEEIIQMEEQELEIKEIMGELVEVQEGQEVVVGLDKLEEMVLIMVEKEVVAHQTQFQVQLLLMPEAEAVVGQVLVLVERGGEKQLIQIPMVLMDLEAEDLDIQPLWLQVVVLEL
jgi:ribosomal protein RSM22 (predicted rRNA methylase)